MNSIQKLKKELEEKKEVVFSFITAMLELTDITKRYERLGLSPEDFEKALEEFVKKEDITVYNKLKEQNFWNEYE